MKKVNFCDALVRRQFYKVVSIISTLESIILLGTNCYIGFKIAIIINIAMLIIIYLIIWWRANALQKISIAINKSNIDVLFGDIFEEKDFKVISFNEYFDTILEKGVISENSLNGKYLHNLSVLEIKELDKAIKKDNHLKDNIVDRNEQRKIGKKIKYQLGTLFKNDKFLLMALSHFDNDNRAYLYMPEFIACLLKFWDEVDIKYEGQTVSLPLLGSGITRLKEYSEISEQEILEIILWTFKISRVKIKYPAKLRIILNSDIKNKISLHKVKSLFY